MRNEGTRHRWLGISVAGVKSNRQGFGARLTVTDGAGREQVQEVTPAGSYLSSNDPRIIFGLGTATSVKSVEIRWPGGRVERIANPPLDRYLTIRERDAAGTTRSGN
jgi:hypothetical protein